METEEIKNQHDEKPDQPKKEIFLLTLFGVCLIPSGFWLIVEIFKLSMAPFGIGQEFCSSDNFWITSLNGVLISLSLVCMIPALVMLGNGVARLIGKRRLAAKAIVGGFLLFFFNFWLSWITYGWFLKHDLDEVAVQATNALKEVYPMQNIYKDQNDTYADDVKKLGSFVFSEVGSIEIASADEKCYTAIAHHECLEKKVVWDSCKQNPWYGE